MRQLQIKSSTRASLSALTLASLTALGPLGCIIVDKQIGQLDDAGTEDSDEGDASEDSSEVTGEGSSEEGVDEDSGELTGEGSSEEGIDGDSGELTGEGSSEDTGVEPDCEAITAAIAETFENVGDQFCAIVIRSGYLSGEVLGWSLECRDDGPELTLAQAQELSTAGGMDLSQSGLDYVLFAAPGDFGGVSFVGKRSGLVFDGSIIWDGLGEIAVPSTVNEPASLGLGCYEGANLAVEYWPYDVMNFEDPYTLPPEGVAALNVVIDSAVFHALQNTPTTTSVLVYPPGVGAFDPSLAEVITIIDRL